MTTQEMKQAITISYDEWMKHTALGPFSRRSETMRGIDQALQRFHQNPSDKSFVELRRIFTDWTTRMKEDIASRNKISSGYPKGIITELQDQIARVDASLTRELMADPKKWEAIQAFRKAEGEALKNIFQNRSLEFKDKMWKPNLVASVNTCMLPAAFGGLAAKKLATGVDLHTGEVSAAVKNLLGNQSPSALFKHLGAGFLDKFVHASGNIVSAAFAPGLFLAGILSAASQINDRLKMNRERLMFSPGQADAALNCIIRLIDRDLVVTGISLGEKVAQMVAGGFGAVPISGAVNAVVDFMVNLRLYATMAQEMEDGNMLLRSGRHNLDLFNASPLLGCYFIVMADVGVWLNYDVGDWGVEGFMDTMAEMYERALPVREKARKLIRMSKYAVSGTEYLGWEPNWANQKGEYLMRLINTRPDQLGGADWIAKNLQVFKPRPRDSDEFGIEMATFATHSSYVKPPRLGIHGSQIPRPPALQRPGGAGMIETPLGTFPQRPSKPK